MMNKKMISLTAAASVLFFSSMSYAGTVNYEGYQFDTDAFADYIDPSWYTQGGSDPGAVPISHTNEQDAIGLPDYSGDPNLPGSFVSLGNGGTLIAQFTNNSLGMSGDSNYDLYIFEVGPDVEGMDVYVGTGLGSFYSVGSVGGATAGVDIDAYASTYGWTAFDTFNYVKLVDKGTNDYASQFSGADIDAIAGGPITPVPIPGAVWLFGSGLAGLLGIRRRK